MTSLNERLQAIAQLFGDVLGTTYHYHKPAGKNAPYAVWAETGEADCMLGDNRKAEQTIEGTLDFYTMTEFDSCVDGFQNVLDTLSEGDFTLMDVQYEEETNLIHYSWTWKAVT